jgi:hypothetical protein
VDAATGEDALAVEIASLKAELVRAVLLEVRANGQGGSDTVLSTEIATRIDGAVSAALARALDSKANPVAELLAKIEQAGARVSKTVTEAEAAISLARTSAVDAASQLQTVYTDVSELRQKVEALHEKVAAAAKALEAEDKADSGTARDQDKARVKVKENRDKAKAEELGSADKDPVKFNWARFGTPKYLVPTFVVLLVAILWMGGMLAGRGQPERPPSLSFVVRRDLTAALDGMSGDIENFEGAHQVVAGEDRGALGNSTASAPSQGGGKLRDEIAQLQRKAVQLYTLLSNPKIVTELRAVKGEESLSTLKSAVGGGIVSLNDALKTLGSSGSGGNQRRNGQRGGAGAGADQAQTGDAPHESDVAGSLVNALEPVRGAIVDFQQNAWMSGADAGSDNNGGRQ